ncbi:MAG: AAA family ATPase, partial [Candidatus Azobacteroides sp.]|nr:AAA family ATPase [Candidatus Azobacteroides sp.]
MSNRRKLPVGIQDFEKLRTENYLYVDKTQYLYDLVSLSQPYFLGRPRRFGKSLFLSMLKAYFQGKKELFEGLAIADLEKEWAEYPVIYIDFNKAAYTNINTLNIVLDSILSDY